MPAKRGNRAEAGSLLHRVSLLKGVPGSQRVAARAVAEQLDLDVAQHVK